MDTTALHNNEQAVEHFDFDIGNVPIAQQGAVIVLAVDHPELLSASLRADGVNADVITVDGAVGTAILTATATLVDGVTLVNQRAFVITSPDADALMSTVGAVSVKTAPNPGPGPAPAPAPTP